jgi:GGDEF domain-containing protein
MIAWNNYGATISRLGGDEFAVMLAGKYTHKDIEDFCAEIISLYDKPVSIGENTLSLTTLA